MATEHRVTTFFSQANMGWSETWWRSAEQISDCAVAVEALLDARMKMLTDDVKVIGVRIAQEGASRVSRLVVPGLNPAEPDGVAFLIPSQGVRRAGPLGTQGDQVRAALQLEIVSAGKRISLRYLAGIPDDVSRSEPAVTNFTTPADWWQDFRSWRRVLLLQGWQIKAQKKDGTSAERLIRKWAVRATDEPFLGFTVDAAPGIAAVVGEKVAVRGVKMRAEGLRSPNGTWVVDSVVDTVTPDRRTIYLRGATGFLVSDIKDLGKARLVAPTYLTPSNIVPFRVGVHKRGRPFGSPPGRRKVRKYV